MCRTALFREYKLCRLLLRALDDRRSAARNSAVRGYSRQSGSEYTSSLSNSADNSANVAELDANEFGWNWNDVHKSALFKHMRPGSRAYSVPTGFAMGRGMESLSYEYFYLPLDCYRPSTIVVPERVLLCNFKLQTCTCAYC
jgi:hypothetical protein